MQFDAVDLRPKNLGTRIKLGSTSKSGWYDWIIWDDPVPAADSAWLDKVWNAYTQIGGNKMKSMYYNPANEKFTDEKPVLGFRLTRIELCELKTMAESGQCWVEVKDRQLRVVPNDYDPMNCGNVTICLLDLRDAETFKEVKAFVSASVVLINDEVVA